MSSTMHRFLRYQPTSLRTEDTSCASSRRKCCWFPFHSFSSSKCARITTHHPTQGALLRKHCTTSDNSITLAPVSSLPVHVQEQSIKAIQKFLNCVAVIDSDPPPAVHCTEAKAVEVDMTSIARVPKAATIDPFAIGHEPIKIGKDLYWKILEELRRGNVPPIYHALVKGKPCVAFRSNTNTIPSSDQVIAGNVPKHIEQCLDGVPTSHRSVTKLQWDIGMDGKNLDSAVNAEGAPYPILTDGNESTWEYVHEYAIAAADLVNQGAEMKGYGVEITPLTATFTIKILRRGDPPPYLITRPESRGVVMSCFDTKYTSAIVGSPGIGKSYNLLFALQQALLYDGANVVLYVCNTATSFLFLRRGNTLYTWGGSHSRRTDAHGSLFHRSNVLVLYDPPEAEYGRNGAFFSLGCRQMIVAMTADRTHRFKAAQKQTGDSFRFLSPPNVKQLSVMLPIINPEESLDVVWDRLKKIGPLPRQLFFKGQYLMHKHAFDYAIKAVQDNIELKELLASDGWVSHRYTFPERLLAVAGARREVVNGQVIPENYEDYEGEHINYKEQIVMALTSEVIDAVCAPGLDVVLSDAWNVYDTDRVPLKDILAKRSKSLVIQKKKKKKNK
jgi:hypothetical protein